MTNLIKHKRVEFSELFYDLVLVFAISKTTALIHHLQNGILTWNSLFDFFMSLLVLINSWMIQTVYTNRYGKNSLFNMVIMFINMGLLLFISNMIGSSISTLFAGPLVPWPSLSSSNILLNIIENRQMLVIEKVSRVFSGWQACAHLVSI